MIMMIMMIMMQMAMMKKKSQAACPFASGLVDPDCKEVEDHDDHDADGDHDDHDADGDNEKEKSSSFSVHFRKKVDDENDHDENTHNNFSDLFLSAIIL